MIINNVLYTDADGNTDGDAEGVAVVAESDTSKVDDLSPLQLSISRMKKLE